MAVYAGEARASRARVGRISARWSHLFADSQDELHAYTPGNRLSTAAADRSAVTPVIRDGSIRSCTVSPP
jgi:hypothetical protein